jgi:hypothetical protein
MPGVRKLLEFAAQSASLREVESYLVNASGHAKQAGCIPAIGMTQRMMYAVLSAAQKRQWELLRII